MITLVKKNSKILLVLILTGIFVFSPTTQAFEFEETEAREKLENVFYLIENLYVDELSYEELMDKAVRGVLEELDPHSVYLTQDEFEEMQQEFEGHFGGIGITVGMEDGVLTVISPIKDTPGDRAGLQGEDVIMEVDGKYTDDMNLQQAVDLMRGEPGTEVTLTILREGESEPLTFDIVRDEIEYPNVESEMKEDKIGYLSLYHFNEDTGEKVNEAVRELEKEGAEALIVDLRGNSGGILDQSVDVTSSFMDEGEVVSVRGRVGSDRFFYADDDIPATTLPVVILINRGSASASEIFAAAMRDHNRGILIGDTTFGKATVQNLLPLEDGSAVKMTVAYYYTPDGTNIDKEGVEPDIEVDYDVDTEEDEQLEKAIELLQSYFDSSKELEAMVEYEEEELVE